MITDSIRALAALLAVQNDPRRRVFAQTLTTVADAVDMIEAVDAEDAPAGSESVVIDKALGSNKPQLTSADAAHLLHTLDRLNAMLIEAEKERLTHLFSRTIENMGGLIMSLGFYILRLGGDPAAINAEWLKKGKDENPTTT